MSIQITKISKDKFLDLALNHKDDFLSRIKSAEVFVVKNFYPKKEILELRKSAFDWGARTEASWHPFHDDCPDYHRLHDNYPKAHVKQKFHAFYFHNFNNQNADKFKAFKEIFDLKNAIAGFEENSFINNKPSDGILPRINVHHYPKGGGYQSEHIDPSGPFAQIQTLIVASEYGKDFSTGGVYAREKIGAQKVFLDPETEIGDLLVLSPAIPHGVAEIDPDQEYCPYKNTGRWMILPLFLYSDYPNANNIKPKEIKNEGKNN